VDHSCMPEKISQKQKNLKLMDTEVIQNELCASKEESKNILKFNSSPDFLAPEKERESSCPELKAVDIQELLEEDILFNRNPFLKGQLNFRNIGLRYTFGNNKVTGAVQQISGANELFSNSFTLSLQSFQAYAEATQDQSLRELTHLNNNLLHVQYLHTINSGDIERK
jgi:hypothetical protein